MGGRESDCIRGRIVQWKETEMVRGRPDKPLCKSFRIEKYSLKAF